VTKPAQLTQRPDAPHRAGSAQRDRAQTISPARRASAWREGKPAGWPAPAA
jgi:hypothetical protein